MNRLLVGYAVVWGAIGLTPEDGLRERFARGTFADSIDHDDISALWRHNIGLELAFNRDPKRSLAFSGAPLRGGRLSLWEDSHGVRFEIEPYENREWIDHLVSRIRDGQISKMSIGFTRLESRVEIAGGYGELAHTVRTTSRAQLLEISPVHYPVFPQTSVRLVEQPAEPATPPAPRREIIRIDPVLVSNPRRRNVRVGLAVNC